MLKFKAMQVVLARISYAEDQEKSKVRPVILLQDDGLRYQAIWATTQKVDSCPLDWEFFVSHPGEMKAMGHDKPARYSFRNGGVVILSEQDIVSVIGEVPRSVFGRMFKAARNA